MTTIRAYIATAARWVVAATDARDVEFVVGLLLVGGAGGRWPIVGAVLVAHSMFGPLLAARRP